MRRAKDDDLAYPEVILVCSAELDDAASFFDQRWPEVRVICDPQRIVYGQFGLDRGKPLQVMGPGVWWSGLRALLKGHGIGAPKGDLLQMSGAFLIQDREVVWSHEYRHSGDHPDFTSLPSACGSAP